MRRIRPFSFYLNGVNRFELKGILYEFVRNIFQAFMTFLKLMSLRDFPLIPIKEEDLVKWQDDS